MRSLIALFVSLVLVVPAFAVDTPEARLRELVRRAGDGTLEEITSEVAPGAFEARPLVEQVVLCTGTSALSALVSLQDASPLKKIVPSATWPKLVKSQATLRGVAAMMEKTVHQTAARALAARDLAPSRLLVGTANIYLREMGEADSAAERAIALFVASSASDVGSQADLQERMLALAIDPLATPEVRERAGHLYPLIADTAARKGVAVQQFFAELGTGR